jgi:hypothetical protein
VTPFRVSSRFDSRSLLIGGIAAIGRQSPVYRRSPQARHCMSRRVPRFRIDVKPRIQEVAMACDEPSSAKHSREFFDSAKLAEARDKVIDFWPTTTCLCSSLMRVRISPLFSGLTSPS